MLLGLCADNLLNADTRAILIENDSRDSMSFEINARDMQLKHRIPGRTRAKFIMQIVQISDPQSNLLNAIVSDSVIDIIKSLQDGANINLITQGKSPLQWAMILGHVNVVNCLVKYGALL